MLSRNDEKKIWMPTMISVAASTAQPLLGQLAEAAVDPGDDDDARAPATPASTIAPPSSRPCSSRKRARMRSNHGSFSPMK